MRVVAVVVAALVVAAPAWAHAEVSPASIAVNRPTTLTLAVPTESATAATVRVVATAPRGLDIGSAMWAGRTRGVVHLRFTARAGKTGDYAIHVQQTYSDGTVVNWAGPEGSNTPAPVVHVSSPGNANHDRLTILLIAAAAIAAWLVLRRVRQRP